MLIPKKVSLSVFMALSLAALPACSSEIGGLIVASAPGEAFEATFPVLNIEPETKDLSVRIARPSSYLEHGYEWAPFMRGLTLHLIPDSNEVVLRVKSETAIPATSFHLLMHLESAAQDAFVDYKLTAKDGRWNVERSVVSDVRKSAAPAAAIAAAAPAPVAAEAQQPAAKAAPAAKPAPKAEPKAAVKNAETTTEKSAEKNAPSAVTSAAKPAPAVRPARVGVASEAVRDYVRANGFDPAKPIEVKSDMTLWSIAQLYWPSYQGVTLDQLVVALRDGNPSAFKSPDGFELKDGATLTPPSPEAVFAVDPMAAFEAVHGKNAAVPGSTKNLIRAQQISPDLARDVAGIQSRLLKAGRSEVSIINAGREMIDGKDLKEVPPTQAVDPRDVEVPPEPEGRPVMNELPANARPLTEVLKEHEAIEAKLRAEDEAAARAAGTAGQPEEASDSTSVTPSAEGGAAPAGLKLEGSEALASAEQPAAGEAQTASAGAPAAETADAVSGDKNAAPASEPVEPAAAPAPAAKKHAQGGVEDLLSMKDKNWWWLLLIPLLIVVLVRTLRQVNQRPKTPSVAGEVEAASDKKPSGPASVTITKNVPKSDSAQLKAVEATVDECVKNGTTAGAMGVGAMAYSAARREEEKASQPWLDTDTDELPPIDEEEMKSAPGSLEKAREAINGVDLDLGAAPAKPAPDAAPEAPEGQPARTEAPAEGLSAQEKALFKAIDAKLKLAQNFAEHGASKEAVELLDEVCRRGSTAQKNLAKALLKNLGGR